MVDNSLSISFNGNDEERRLINDCKANLRSAQKKFYEKYFGKLMSIARRYIVDNEMAMEVVNTSFVKIFSNIEQFKGTGSLAGWISRIVTNTALDYIRSNKKYEDNILLNEEITADYDYLVDEEQTEGIEIKELYQMIDKLPLMCRTVFNLYVVEGYSHQEIGKELGISDGTSKAHLSVARKKLKEMILNRKSDR